MAKSLEESLDALESEEGVQGLENRRSTPLTDDERGMVMNLFDSQPKRRVAYMKRLGFEVKPDDTNLYRPLGSKGSWGEIDPWGDSIVTAAFKEGGLKKYFSELWKDVGDVGFDVAVSGPIVAAGAKAGVVGGGAVGGPIGAGAGGILGGIFGGAAGNAAAEVLKKEIGDTLLDEDIPLDKQSVVIQSMITGVAPLLTKGLVKGGQAAIKIRLDAQKEALKAASKKFGTNLTEDMIGEITKNPEKYTPQAVEGATTRLGTKFKKLFGMDPDKPLVSNPEQVQRGSIFGDAIAPLNEQAENEITRLSTDPRATWKVGEITAPMQKIVNRLSQKFDRTADEDAALSYFRKKIEYVEGKVTPPDAPKYTPKVNGKAISPVDTDVALSGKAPQPFNPSNETISFRDGYEVLKAIQDDAHNLEVPGSRFIKQSISGLPGGIRGISETKALAAGSTLPHINAQRHKILDTYNIAKENLTPTKLQQAYLTNSDNMGKAQTRETLSMMDEVLGTNASKELSDANLQRAVSNMYKAAPQKGSSVVNAEAIGGAAKGAVAGATAGAAVGFPTGTAAITVPTGAILGAARGAKNAVQAADPMRLVENLVKNAEKSKAADVALSRPVSAATEVAGSIAAQLPQLGEKNAYESLFDQIE